MIQVISYSTGKPVPFNVRLVEQGEKYGRDMCLTHDKPDPLVEFYDARFRHEAYGQFVSRYFLSTLMEGDSDRGLNMDFGIPAWRLDGPAFSKALDYVVAKYNFNTWRNNEQTS